ncbi:VOC family protein [Cellulomonas sp. H30R-01]|uniref:VOC family protein n=1 Tax=Cellulomonas sp. H30R-01 TaxID=2704467 RepID=UPI00138B5F3F|nr:VOC family protein [Cellulomonas sp. H30R-01]QHT56862.1 VOC family protein [Cellulomonas sp. H30R-01]
MAAPVTLRGISTLSLWADDVTAAGAWYADLLGVEPYYARPEPPAAPSYLEFRLGDHGTELGIIDRRFALPGLRTGEPGGIVAYWAVDDVQKALDTFLAAGATPLQPITEFGPGFVTAAVVDPFGNVVGLMYNQHYLDQAAGDA